MRTRNQIREDNYFLLKRLIQNTLDFNETSPYLNQIEYKSFLKECCTIKLYGTRQSGHSTNALRILWDFPFKNILYLTYDNSVKKFIQDKFEQVSVGELRTPEGIVNIERHLFKPVKISRNSLVDCSDIPFKIYFHAWKGLGLDKFRGSIETFDLIISDIHCLVPKTKEDELYHYCCILFKPKLLLFLQ